MENTIVNGKANYKWQFSIAMFTYQRVYREIATSTLLSNLRSTYVYIYIYIYVYMILPQYRPNKCPDELNIVTRAIPNSFPTVWSNSWFSCFISWTYCGWKNSWTNWQLLGTTKQCQWWEHNRINHVSAGAGLFPSTLQTVFLITRS